MTSSREKLLDLLGKNNAFVLGGHIHRFYTLCRTAPGGGRLAQLSISHVVGNADVKPGHAAITINGDQVQAVMYSGITRNVYKTVDLMKLLAS